MSDIIQLLPDSVANQIAAGEVIQRPASVIKELVENSVDAGAKNIDVAVVDAGRTSIQVIDDGKGMSETDARLAFERHATSKIRQAEDLFNLHTNGFRGEALASIAAVAQVVLKSRQEGEEVGTQLSISGSRFEGQEACSSSVGSVFSVNNLFYNVPARRKFLKSNSTELNNILTAFERIVLVNPQIAFTLHSNNTELFNLKAGNLRQRIIDVFGKRINQDLLPVNVETTMCKISGFVGKPESARKKGAHQFFFVNGRYMKHPYFNKAVMTAYDRLVPQGEQVPYFLYFDVNPNDIDVNIHPTKTEIKFENEQAIWQILMAAVKESIGMFNDVPSIDFDTEDKPDIPVYNPDVVSSASAPKISLNPHYNPFKSSPSSGKPTAVKPVDEQWEQLYEGLNNQDSVEREADIFESESETEINTSQSILAEKSPAHYQYKGKYVMTAVKSGLMIIDQHRAHVRVLYERYLEQIQQQTSHSQKVLFPEVLQFPVSDEVILEKLLPEMSKMGFELDNLGGGSYAVNAIPTGLDGVNPLHLVQDMVFSAKEKGVKALDEVHQSLALTLARNAAIPQGQVLSNEEMETLVNDLFACSNVNYTPDGKNVLCILKQQEIEHLLG
ncbi:DNA mismatch repair endonuclease MutL [Prevotella hominis]|uniref:DNA mismatch repair endonuclease MutL n=1 Tax=Segatella hominis TaxID=2518605 RepID=UPI001F299917|nr:DNA mismatch repair endonuclease MutL [Segatella hominis]MCF2590962.1 DNA mismatch repair endonuclease MutL [Segatella hominis]